jgi:UDP-glucose 4-epimerase
MFPRNYKVTLEKYIQMLGHTDNLDYVILRLSNPFGPGQEFRKGQGLVPAILSCWRKGLPIRIFGNGQAMRDYIFVDDAIDAIEAALAMEGNPRLILNIGSGELRSVIEVVETIERIVGQHFQREYHGARATDVDVAGLDISRAMAMLKWHPKTGFFDGLKKTIEANLADHA